jgi:hypothetical protein
MEQVTVEEIMSALGSSGMYSAPGSDGVNSGVWKMAVNTPVPNKEGGQQLPCREQRVVTRLLHHIINECLQCQDIPALAKCGIIVPLPKKGDIMMDCKNIRPITLQVACIKFVSKVLASRLKEIWDLTPIF